VPLLLKPVTLLGSLQSSSELVFIMIHSGMQA
jgi:hypothetical protein